MKRSFQNPFLLATVLLITGCAELAKHADAIKPTAKLAGSRIANINFEQIDLVFDLAIENRNPVALNLAGLDYDFRIENQSLVSGVTGQALSIKADSTSTVQLPVSLKFEDLKKLAGELGDRDTVAYQLNTTFNVELPVIGNYPVPVSKQGELPVPKMPSVKLRDISIRSLGFTSAEVVAQVEVDNPNAFRLGLSDFNYELNINRQSWGQGTIAQPGSIPGKGAGIVEIPLKLNLLAMGQAAYRMVANKESFEYRLTGGVTLDTGIELLRNVAMPLDIEGKAGLD